jgi:beta-carotene hydroxylase
MIPRPPEVAGFTFLLAGVCLLTTACTVWATAMGWLPWPVATLVATLTCFAGFTPVHEAAHGNVHHWRPLNDAVGHACATLLTGALLPYRFLHREHHRHTNVDGADPDLWGGRGATWALPLRWLTQDVGYLWFYGRRWRQRPLLERANLVISLALYVVVLGVALWAGPRWLLAVVAGWFVPARLALLALACTFAWLPHAPHTATSRYQSTTVRSHPLLTWLLLGQNFHGLHHIYPRVPFYRMASTWRAIHPEMQARGMVDAWPGDPY